MLPYSRRMPVLILRLGLRMDDGDPRAFPRNHGPRFHRWLPNGEADAIALTGPKDPVRVSVWFDRRGFVRDGFIVFDETRREVDPLVIPRQAVLDAGPLLGRVEVEVSHDEMTAIHSNDQGGSAYVGVGKRVVKALQPLLSALVDLLRVDFGQYWLPEFDMWDSRTWTLGAYCGSVLGLRFSDDEGATWGRRFEPDHSRTTGMLQTIVMGGTIGADYIREEDWTTLPSRLRLDEKRPISDEIVVAAHELLDRGNYRHALMEAFVALELVVEEICGARRRTAGPKLSSVIDQLERAGLAPLILALPMLAPDRTFQRRDIEGAVEAYGLRNRATHEGWTPTSAGASKLRRRLSRPQMALRFAARTWSRPLRSDGARKVALRDDRRGARRHPIHSTATRRGHQPGIYRGGVLT